MGGMGIDNQAKKAMEEFLTSSAVTENHTQIIYNQERDFQNYNKEKVKQTIIDMKGEKETRLEDELAQIIEIADAKTKRHLNLAL